MERNFQLMIFTEDFSEMQFRTFLKIIAGSQLDVTSELVTFKAVEAWVKHKFEKRATRAFKLLSKVRMHLLPVAIFKQLKTKTTCLSKLENFDAVIQKAIEDKKVPPAEWNKSAGNRFCNQNSYSIMSIGGVVNNKVSADAYLLHGKYFQDKAKKASLQTLAPTFLKKYYNLHAINLNGTV